MSETVCGQYRVVIRDLEIRWRVGVYQREQADPQPLRISVDMTVRAPADMDADDYAAVPCYDQLSGRIRALAAQRHVGLIETVAHRIAGLCLQDGRVQAATVQVEKPHALADARAAVIVTRSRTAPAPETVGE